MKFKGLDLNLLVALDALLREQSVTIASERLHLTQSAVSNALARLRGALGNELLVQSGKKMILTPFAEELRGQVREILATIETMMRSDPGFQPSTSNRHFRIGCSDFVAETVLIRTHQTIAQTAPGITLEFVPMVSSDIYNQLQQGEIDLIIAPDHYCQQGNRHAPLFNIPWVCIAWSGNAEVGDTITLQQYERTDHVILKPSGRAGLDQIYLDQVNISRRVKTYAPTLSLIPRLIVGTNRIATVPNQAISIYASIFPLRIVSPLFGIPDITEVLQWHPSRDHDTGFAWLRQVIAESVIRLE